ncbi:MAG: MurR/RpiR family transcriptional regulator [Andreesenia angusta]|nr:MurR/RpiR family transcriptional regulator [Andreesenia angusta]
MDNDEKMNRGLFTNIAEQYEELSKSHKMIADYLNNNYDKVANMTAAKLADIVGISESTVVRFATAIGYPGYPEFQAAVQELSKNRLTTVQRIDMEDDYTDKEFDMNTVLKKDIDNIRAILDRVDNKEFNKAIQMIIESRKVYIIGLRSSNALAEYLGFYLRVVLEDVQVISLGISDVFEQLVRIRENDLLIGISYPRYSKRTIEAVKYAKNQGANIIAITDSELSPLKRYADYSLYAKSNMLSFVDSLVAPLSLINALIVGVGLKQKSQIKEYFDELEKMWRTYNVYDRIYDE